MIILIHPDGTIEIQTKPVPASGEVVEVDSETEAAPPPWDSSPATSKKSKETPNE